MSENILAKFGRGRFLEHPRIVWCYVNSYGLPGIAVACLYFVG